MFFPRIFHPFLLQLQDTLMKPLCRHVVYVRPVTLTVPRPLSRQITLGRS